MEQRSIFSYIWVGTAIRYLIDARTELPVHGPHAVLRNIRDLRKRLSRYGLTVSARAAELQLAEILGELEATDEDAKLTEAQAAALTQRFMALRDVIEAEAGGKIAFIVTDKRYTVQTLLDKIDGLLPAGTFAKLPEVARFDLAQAGKCIAFELPTAAAFHVLRGTEDVLRQFYQDWVRTKRVKVMTWGAMTKDIGGRKVKPPEALLNHLDHIREHFRNPTDHPEKVYDIDEAQDLLALCCDAIGRMVQLHRPAPRTRP